jgi:hypothetical protein
MEVTALMSLGKGSVRRFALAALAVAALSAGSGGAPAASAPGYRGLPVAVEFGKHEGDLSPSEVDFIAHNVGIAALEHFGGKQRPYAYQEDGVYANAARLKAANPALKVLEYWGFSGRRRRALVRDPLRRETPPLGYRESGSTGVVGRGGGQDGRRGKARRTLHRRRDEQTRRPLA